jgi:NADH dehydrogenase [ubiquinone] 1 alpha subcomplex assembly factor 7
MKILNMNELKKNSFDLYNRVKKEIQNSKTKSIDLTKLLYFVSYGKNSGYYHENAEVNILDDFITSPMISRFFGYFLGFFLYSKWLKFFYKTEIDLIELGPGTGILCFEILNFLKETEMFQFIKTIKLVEINHFLKQKQNEKLKIFSKKLEFYSDFGLVQFNKPFFIFSNEFFDCLPVNQFIFKDSKFL